MQCVSCKEVVDEKFQAAFLQNACPMCGKAIYTFSKAEYAYRKKLNDILKASSVEPSKADTIVEEVCKISQDMFKPRVAVASTSPVAPRVRVATQKVPLNNMGGDIGGEIDPNDLANNLENEAEIPPTNEEEAEVQRMLASGEITFVNTVEETAAQKKAAMLRAGKVVNPPKPLFFYS